MIWNVWNKMILTLVRKVQYREFKSLLFFNPTPPTPTTLFTYLPFSFCHPSFLSVTNFYPSPFPPYHPFPSYPRSPFYFGHTAPLHLQNSEAGHPDRTVHTAVNLASAGEPATTPDRQSKTEAGKRSSCSCRCSRRGATVRACSWSLGRGV